MPVIELESAGIADYVIAGRPVGVEEMLVRLPGNDFGVSLRTHSSDFATFRQIFVDRDCELGSLIDEPKHIIDLGSNIGLASVFYVATYKDARVFAVEPDRENFLMASKNTLACGDRVSNLHAAAWTAEGTVKLHVARSGYPIDSWGRFVSLDGAPGDVVDVPAYPISKLIQLAGFSHVDILKIDIEGAEFDIFSQPDIPWLSAIRVLVIEIHERFRAGTEEIVRNALAPGFEKIGERGMNQYYRNRRFS